MFPRIDYQVQLSCLYPDCEENFKQTKELIAHVRSEHEKTLKCPYCDKPSKYGAGLIHHVRIHTGEKPYFCPVNGCKFRSATKNNLKVHLSGKMHGMDVLMNFAHIFDRPRKRRRMTDLPDIIVKKNKSSMMGGLHFPMQMPMMISPFAQAAFQQNPTAPLNANGSSPLLHNPLQNNPLFLHMQSMMNQGKAMDLSPMKDPKALTFGQPQFAPPKSEIAIPPASIFMEPETKTEDSNDLISSVGSKEKTSIVMMSSSIE